MERVWAVLSYLPVPGWAVVPLLAGGKDRLVAYHALQGGLWVLLSTVALTVVGFLVRGPSVPPAVEALAGLVVFVSLVGSVTGAVSAARGRYVRVRPAWDLLSRR